MESVAWIVGFLWAEGAGFSVEPRGCLWAVRSVAGFVLTVLACAFCISRRKRHTRSALLRLCENIALRRKNTPQRRLLESASLAYIGL